MCHFRSREQEDVAPMLSMAIVLVVVCLLMSFRPSTSSCARTSQEGHLKLQLEFRRKKEALTVRDAFFATMEDDNASADKDWLQDLFNSTNGSGWDGSCSSGWQRLAGTNPCHGSSSLWSRVVCNTDGRVSEVDLSDCNLRGTLPDLSSAMSLSQLQQLDLSNNQLYGSLPASFGRLISLETIAVNDNQLTGSIPESFGGLSHLRTLHLDKNLLNGTLPSSLGNLSQLRMMDLHANALRGTIPRSWCELGSITFLSLALNFISGELPTTCVDGSHLSALTAFDVEFNCLNLTVIANSTVLTWWASKSTNGSGLQFQRRSCNCGRGQLILLSEYWCEDCPAGHYCPNTSTSIACPAGTYNPDSGRSNASACLRCPTGTNTSSVAQDSIHACNAAASWNVTALSTEVVQDQDWQATRTAMATGIIASAASVFLGGDLTAIDMVMLASVQTVRCSDPLRRSSGHASSASLLKYLMSPFSDLGPSMSTLGNIGLIAAIIVIHFVVVRIQLLRVRANVPSQTRAVAVKQQRTAMSDTFFPAVSLMVASVLISGTAHGGIVAVTTLHMEAIDITACIMACLLVAGMMYVWAHVVIRWCGGHGAVFRRHPMQWVQRIRGTFVSAVLPVHWLLPQGQWTQRRTQRRFGIVFASVAGRVHRWVPGGLLMVSVTVGMVSAAPVAITDTNGCSALHAVLAVLTILPAAVIVLRRAPYRVGAVNGFVLLNSTLTSIITILIAVAVQDASHSDAKVAVIDAMTTAVSVSSALRTALLIGLRIAAQIFGGEQHIRQQNDMQQSAPAAVQSGEHLTILRDFIALQQHDMILRFGPQENRATCLTDTFTTLKELVDLACTRGRLNERQ